MVMPANSNKGVSVVAGETQSWTWVARGQSDGGSEEGVDAKPQRQAPRSALARELTMNQNQ